MGHLRDPLKTPLPSLAYCLSVLHQLCQAVNAPLPYLAKVYVRFQLDAIVNFCSSDERATQLFSDSHDTRDNVLDAMRRVQFSNAQHHWPMVNIMTCWRVEAIVEISYLYDLDVQLSKAVQHGAPCTSQWKLYDLLSSRDSDVSQTHQCLLNSFTSCLKMHTQVTTVT